MTVVVVVAGLVVVVNVVTGVAVIVAVVIVIDMSVTVFVTELSVPPRYPVLDPRTSTKTTAATANELFKPRQAR